MDMTKWELRAEMENSKVYQSKTDSSEYAILRKFSDPKIKSFKDNSELENLLNKLDPSDIEGSYYPISNRISVLFSEAK